MFFFRKIQLNDLHLARSTMQIQNGTMPVMTKHIIISMVDL